MGEDTEYCEATACNWLHDRDRCLRQRGEHEGGAAHVQEEPADPEPVERVTAYHLELEGERREDLGALLLEDLAYAVPGGAGQRERHRLPHLSAPSIQSDPIRHQVPGARGVSPILALAQTFWSRGGESTRAEGGRSRVAFAAACALFRRALPCLCLAELPRPLLVAEVASSLDGAGSREIGRAHV